MGINYWMRTRIGQSGMTLVEVMIACVILALVAAVSLPWYGDHVRRGRIAEGVDLGTLARVRAAELVTIGQVSSGGVDPKRHYNFLRAEGAEYQPPEPDSEVISVNPSPYVTQVLRVKASYVVTYASNLDPEANVIYSIVYYANVSNGTVTWTCLVGDRARNSLENAATHSRVYLGLPLPLKLAPEGCVG